MLALTGCGRLEDKFKRINNGYTRVSFHNDSPLYPMTPQLQGGLMVYFVSLNGGNSRAIGFPNEETALSRTLLLPNGLYRVLAYGSDGTSGKALEGPVRCGLGNGGSDVALFGGNATITLTISNSACGYSTGSLFQPLENANTGYSDLDTAVFNFCTGTNPSCSPATAGTYYMKVKLLGGEAGPGQSGFAENPGDTITSTCSTAASSGGALYSNFRLPLGSSFFSPPIAMEVYADSNCTTGAVATYNYSGGLYNFISVATGTSVWVDLPATNSNTYFNIPKIW